MLRRAGFAAREREAAARRGWSILTPADPGYPAPLRRIADPPLALYVEGDPAWLAKPAVAIVGSRQASPYGRAVAETLAAQLARRGIVVTSGFARGVDAAAHRSAIRAGGGTIAVLGCALDIGYPRGHEELRTLVAGRGCLVSEFPLGTAPRKDTFPRRNRIISGLSLGVMVAEAHDRSGALITARLAGEQGREVFAVPGNIFSPTSRGPNRLLRDGARLVESAEDIVEELAALLPPAALVSPEPGRADGPAEARVMGALGPEPVQADALARTLALPMSQLLSVLSILELKRLVRSHPGKRFTLA